MQRRQQKRAHMKFPVFLRAEGTKGAIEVGGMDFSPAGVFVVTRTPPAEGSRFQLEFDLGAGDGKVHVDARCVRSVTSKQVKDESLWGAGLEFTRIDESDRARLEDWVKRFEPFEKNAPIPLEAPAPEPEPEVRKSEIEVRLRLQGFEYLTRHQDVKMTSDGLFIGTDSPLPTGSQVDLELEDKADGHVHRVKGRVQTLVTTKIVGKKGPSPGMTIRITGANEQTREFLKGLYQKTARPFMS
ncbi:MAG: PilZ domain-containing protein [Planctomycetota bacterium]|nr:PilZ domain-containing protein [Planctomycetota bacterium]